MISRRASIAWYVLAVLVGLVLWLESCGRTYLEGFPLEVLEKLCAVRGLTPVEGSALYRVLAVFPLDSALVVSLFCALTMTAAYALVWFTGGKVWENPVSPTLACTLLFLGGETFWVQADSPGESLGVLALCFGFACVVAGKLPLLGVATVLSLLSAPAYGFSFALLLLYLSRLRRETYGTAVTALTAGVGVVSVLYYLYSFGLSPALSGWSFWTFLPLFGTALSRELRESRLGLYAVLLGGSALVGAPETASAIFLGDLVVVGLRERPVDTTLPGAAVYASVPRSTLVGWLGFVLTLAAALKGEQDLNRTILIPAQKSKVSISTLFIPFSLEAHADGVAAGRWPGKTPYPQLGPLEIEAARALDGPFRVLTLESIGEARDLSLLTALLSEEPLHGWSSPRTLSTSSLTCKAVGTNVVVGETAILRDHGKLEVSRGPELPKDLSKLARLDLLDVWSLPFRAQELTDSKNSGYRLVSSDLTETLYFSNVPARIAFSANPDRYKIIDLQRSDNSRELEIHPFELSLKSSSLDAPLPSRSLVELEFTLTNTGTGPISHRELDSVTLGVTEGESFTPFEQSWPGKIVLFPQETIPLKLYLATPEREDRFALKASFKTVDGAVTELPITGNLEFKSWRRLPAVGTWIEKP